MSKVYELYQCEYKGEVLYVGQGKRGRHRHCNSGCSHVYKLNEIHFTEGKDPLTVKIVKEFSSKLDAEKEEVALIQKCKPKLNKIHNGDCSRQNNVDESIALKKSLLEKYLEISDAPLTRKDYETYASLVNEFYGYFGYKMLVDKSFTMFGAGHYKNQGFRYLRNLATRVRTQGIVKNRANSPYIVFIKALYLCCGIDLIEHLDKYPESLKGSSCINIYTNLRHIQPKNV